MANDETEGAVLFGKFKLDRVLGAGRFGEVHLAKNLRTGESVAIKAIIKSSLQEFKRGEDRITTEISIMITLKHPNIVKLYEVMVSETKIYLVMEYVNGGTLEERIGSDGEPEDTARIYFQQLISALEFCHRRGIYHRDLKPNNLLLDNTGNLKICDFGLSTFQEHAGEDGLFYTFCGSRCYIAPEMLSRLHYDGAKLDIWACGVILYQLLSGALPFGDGRDLVALLNNMCMRKYSCQERFSCEVCGLLFRLLDPNPHSRISIPEIMEVAWLKAGFKDNKTPLWPLCWPSGKQQESNNSYNIEEYGNPPCLNAFTLVASWPSGLDLTPLFGGSRGVLRFMSKQPVSSIISKFENIAEANSFSFREQQCRIVNMDGKNIGVEVEIFEVVPSIYAVDVRKTDGDRTKYEHFRDQLMIPALQEIVWAWPQNSRHNKKTESMDHAVKAFLVGACGALLFMSIRAALNKK